MLVQRTSLMLLMSYSRAIACNDVVDALGNAFAVIDSSRYKLSCNFVVYSISLVC